MFIRTTRNAAGQAYYHLVESYRDEGKVRQRTLLSLGRVEDGKLQELASAIAKHTELNTALDLAKSVDVESTYVLGPLLVLQGLFERLGIDEVLERVQGKHPRLGLSLREAVFNLTVSRFVRPSSKLSVYEHLLGSLYPAMAGAELNLHQLYRSLDVLAASKDDIEVSLFSHGRDLFTRQVDVVLYDLTTLRFESTQETELLRRFGYSKERRNDCTQVVLGLLVDTHGIPLGFEVYPGNTMEGKTLTDIVRKMRDKFSVRRFIFVADRGLLSKENLASIKQVDGEFIVGMRIAALSKKRPELYDRSKFTRVMDGLEILETQFDDDRGIVTWSRERAERDAQVRQDILDKIGVKLSKKTVTAKTFVSNSNYHFFLKGLDKGQTPELDPDKRIVGHLTLCFISLLCEAHITRALRENHDRYRGRAVSDRIIKPRQLSAVTALRELAEVRAIPIKIGGRRIWVRTDIKGHVAKLFQSLGLRIPPKLISQEAVVAQDGQTSVIC